jgi:hypothetical protein
VNPIQSFKTVTRKVNEISINYKILTNKIERESSNKIRLKTKQIGIKIIRVKYDIK